MLLFANFFRLVKKNLTYSYVGQHTQIKKKNYPFFTLTGNFLMIIKCFKYIGNRLSRERGVVLF